MHVVTFVWKEEVTAEEVDDVRAALAALPERIPALQTYRFGPDARLRPGNGDFGIVATVADEAGLRAYLDDPVHVVVGATLRAMADSRLAVQVVIDH